MTGTLDWKWIGIGVVVMIVLNLIAGLILGLFLGSQLEGVTTPEEIQLTGGQIVSPPCSISSPLRSAASSSGSSRRDGPFSSPDLGRDRRDNRAPDLGQLQASATSSPAASCRSSRACSAAGSASAGRARSDQRPRDRARAGAVTATPVNDSGAHIGQAGRTDEVGFPAGPVLPARHRAYSAACGYFRVRIDCPRSRRFACRAG